MAVDLHYEMMCEYYGYILLRTGMGDCAMHPDLSHLYLLPAQRVVPSWYGINMVI